MGRKGQARYTRAFDTPSWRRPKNSEKRSTPITGARPWRAISRMLALLLAAPALHLPAVLHRVQPAGRCSPRPATPPTMSSLFPLSRRETLLLLPLTLVGLGGIRYATTDAFPVSLEGPIAQAASVDMSNKVAVVTGANTGIGYETALRLAQEGATVVLAGRSASRLSDAADRIRSQLTLTPALTGKVEVMPLDLASLESVRGFAKALCAATTAPPFAWALCSVALTHDGRLLRGTAGRSTARSTCSSTTPVSPPSLSARSRPTGSSRSSRRPPPALACTSHASRLRLAVTSPAPPPHRASISVPPRSTFSAIFC